MRKKKLILLLLLPAVLAALSLPVLTAYAAEDDTLSVSKTVTDNGDGSFKVTIEAYSTAESDPVDIVLVLDQSAAMSGNYSTDNGNISKQNALKQAVSTFIDDVASKYNSASDHRISVISYTDSATLIKDWTAANTSNLSTEIANALGTASGDSAPGLAMELAKTQMSGNYNYQGTNTTRNKIVIFFSGDVPITNSFFNDDTANAAIKAAAALKSPSVGATVYSIGFFSGANKDQLYGTTDASGTAGAVGYSWTGSILKILFTWDNTLKEAAIPAGNRALNYISSNAPYTVENLGLDVETSGDPSGWISGASQKYTISTVQACSTNSGYYLSGNKAEDLYSSFSGIAGNIKASASTLGTGTTVKDVVSEPFKLPAAADVKVYTTDASGGQKTAFTSASVSVDADSRSISVSGFNYTANAVNGSAGKKLIIEYNITPKEGFLGGNNVPTGNSVLDTNEPSGIYDPSGSKVKTLPVPAVNVPVKNVTVTAPDKNVYLMGSVDAAALRNGVTASAGSSTIDLSASAVNYGLEAWQNKFVTVTPVYTDPTSLSALTDDGSYALTLTLTPGTTAAAVGAPASARTATGTGNIYVFKPKLTYRDLEVYYGDTAPDSSVYSTALTAQAWIHPTATGAVEGSAPALSYLYIPGSGISGGKVESKSDIPVTVSVAAGGRDVTDCTVFDHAAPVPPSGQFLLRPKTCELTVQKTGGSPGETCVFTVNKGGNKYTEATVTCGSDGSGSTTIKGLPVGSYSVTEDTSWSWRSSPSYSAASITLNPSSPQGTVSCTNTLTDTRWLNGYSNVIKNIFGQ